MFIYIKKRLKYTMDITNVFKACVKTVRTRNKAFGIGGNSEKPHIFPKKGRKIEFIVRAKEVLGHIVRLNDFILEHRKAYLNFARHLSETPHMSDIERDRIDSGAQRIISTCSHLIQDLKKDLCKLNESPQVKEHAQLILELVESYLKSVCKLHSEQRAIRVKRSIEYQKMLKLESGFQKTPSNEFEIINKPSPKEKENEEVKLVKEEEEVTEKPSSVTEDKNNSFLLSDDEALSAEEVQMFEMENMQMFNELNSLSEEVKQIQTKVVRIAELQEIFTEKVLQQETDIDRIAGSIVGSTENVKDANEQIRQAMKSNAGLRVWILFCLLVLSFSLLFLDWYND